MLKLWTISLLLISLLGCATVYNPATERKEVIFIPTSVEVAIGNTVTSKISKEIKITRDNQKINRVAEIGKKIADVSDRKDLKYNFTVIDDERLNAFTVPGGYVYINSGLVEMSNDDELACVIGHEVAHISARHIAKKLQAQIGYDLLINIAARKAGLRELERVASISYDLVLLGYSREDELLADRLGVKYAHKAGYDAYAMIGFLKKLGEANNEEVGPVFLRSHPYTVDRIKMLKKGIPAIIEKQDKKLSLIRETDSRTVSINNINTVRVMCPVCRRVFPGATNYCPYDGTKLK